MSALDSLPPDQKAVLQLLLKQGKSYEDLSKLLRIEPGAVRERALDAMDSLGPEDASGLDEQHQDQVADYLLGQAPPDEAAATRTFLEGSPGGRAWARVVSGELQPLAPAGLPDIPADGAGRGMRDAPPAAVGAPGYGESFDDVDDRADDHADDHDDGEDADEHDRGRTEAGPGTRSAGGPRSSKLGGVILLLGIAALLALVLVVVLNKDDGANKPTSATTTTPATPAGTTASTPAGQLSVEQQINLTPAAQGSKALGVANVVSQQGKRGIALIGQGVKPAGRRYAVWLINAKTSRFLGFAPPVKDDGRLQGLAGAPNNLADFSEIIVTRETVDQPQQPGTVVLRGPLRAK